MKLRPSKRGPAAKKPLDKDADRIRKRSIQARREREGGKKIRPGRFLNLATLEDTIKGKGVPARPGKWLRPASPQTTWRSPTV